MPTILPAQPFAHFAPPVREADALRRNITASYRLQEAVCVAPLIEAASFPAALRASISQTTTLLIERLRANPTTGGVQALVQEFSLSSREGVALMCLAEALLRIPDHDTRDALIRDKISTGDWISHMGSGKSMFVNAATWGLAITGKLTASIDESGLGTALTRLIARVGEPVIRRGVDVAMRMMGEQFVMGQTIEDALQRSRQREARGFSFSYDMLGEAAATAADAARYFADYEQAIHAIGKASNGRSLETGPGISIKLSALHPRYSRSQAARVMSELLPRVRKLAQLACSYRIGFNIDAEEADRLEISLDILQSLAEDPGLSGWNGLGFVIQAYQKRCPAVIDWIVHLARTCNRRIMVRLVKGAYWDAEIKRAQVDGLIDFPVYTRKVHTDLAYIACARKLLAASDAVFPQFATHNAQTLATIYHLAGPGFKTGDYEFQCLHGMGEPLYDEVVGPEKLNRPCRVYAPVGTHETLLAYLVRRLLENGANSSFVNRINDPQVSIADLVSDPVDLVHAMAVPGASHDKIALPGGLYSERQNSMGIDLSDEHALAALSRALGDSAARAWIAGSADPTREKRPVLNPADHRDIVGYVHRATEADARNAARTALAASASWQEKAVGERAACLERAADMMQARMPMLMGLAMREAGKSAANAISEVREAIDFLRFYPAQARRSLGLAEPLGPVVCISPWNFPLAIFTGQVAAALAAGNPVLAKPSSETPLIAAAAVDILHEAGVPKDVLQLVPGSGAIGAALIAAPETAGVIFTGSTGVGRTIQNLLAGRLGAHGAPIPFVAETGGLNAMIVDSSALSEQVVADVLASAFDSAGQRCSALRLLCLQEDIADRTLAMLKGAMAELSVGNTDQLSVDIGPVISARARDEIRHHIERLRHRGYPVEQVVLGGCDALGTFVAPTLIELPSISELGPEVFGPVLHVVRFKSSDLDQVIAQINATGYGLTFGLHTRLDETVARVTAAIAAGNLYINRNIIGAVVGVQPFGGRGLSGTGPKAGGPVYVTRFAQGAKTQLPLPDGKKNAALEAFQQWSADRGWDSGSVIPAYAQSSRLGQEFELEGPVGEKNHYSFHPRGRIGLVASTEAGLWNQVAAVLATGNIAVIMAASPVSSRPSDFPECLAKRVEWTEENLEHAPALSAVLIDGDATLVASATRALALREGAIVTAHVATTSDAARHEQQYNLDLLLEEVSISINTTAAGGNASLMAMA